jgi:murein DD-endopeptidase MepM/ murein hydrolase activator NlpD
MKRIRVIFACVLGLCILALGTSLKNRAEVAAAENAAIAAFLDETPTPQVLVEEVNHSIQKGETFGTILQKYNVPNTRGIVAAAKPYFDLTKIRAGKELQFRTFSQTKKVFSLSYRLDEDRTLQVFLGKNPAAQMHEARYTKHLSSKIIQVNNTLWGAAMEAGLRPGDIVRLANIFQWDVDFARELRQGARFTLVAEELVREDGENTKLGEIHAVRLENDGKVYTAIHFTKQDGEDGWFAPDGKASKRPFLRSPLEFSRVTSKFNPKRFHPILKKRRPHLGVDYGAPRGTPIRAIGAGVVRYSGKRGGYGNFVKIDHAGPYHTQYAHLHRIKVRNGQRVKQGQIIGTVGSTGLATGPHLHFEFLSNGRHVDPTKVNVPTVEPLPKAERASFFQVRDQWLPILEEAASPSLANLTTE